MVATKEPNLPVFDINNEKYKLILHPKSKGSAREWGLDRFGELIEALPEDEFHIIVTGTADEGKLMNDFIKRYSHRLTDLTGKLDLKELISVISLSDGLVAASTGPLHIAAALGINAIGIYPPIVPMHPGRWKPVGKKALHLVVNKTCNDCRKTSDCKCMREITPEQVKKLLQSTLKYKPKNIH